MSLILRHLNLDNALDLQPGFTPRLSQADRIDAADIGPKLRLVAQRSAHKTLVGRLARWRRATGPTLTFYGSGDFHHITADLIDLLETTVSVIHFDNHPDWVRFPANNNCGGWINRALALPHVRKIVTLGIGSDDLDYPEFKFANLEAIRQGQLEVHALQARRTRLLGGAINVPGMAGHKFSLTYDGMTNFETSLAQIIARLPDLPLYITLDKDVLPRTDAITNWDQGKLSLENLERALEMLFAARHVLAMDICGDWSIPQFSDIFRKVISITDRAAFAPDPDEVARINGTSNACLLATIERLCTQKVAA